MNEILINLGEVVTIANKQYKELALIYNDPYESWEVYIREGMLETPKLISRLDISLIKSLGQLDILIDYRFIRVKQRKCLGRYTLHGHYRFNIHDALISTRCFNPHRNSNRTKIDMTTKMEILHPCAVT